MSTGRKPPLQAKDLRCLGHLKRVFTLLDRLQDVGTERDTAGNRRLFFGDYCKLVLLYVWNPLIDSLRVLREALALEPVAKALGVRRFSLGSFSEAPRAFDPERLKPVIAELAAELRPLERDPRLAQVKHAITLVDSTVLTALGRLAKAAVGAQARFSTARDGRAVYGWRLHTQLELDTFSPHRIASFQVIEERLLSDEALAAGVVRDAVVALGDGRRGGRHAVRLVAVQVEPHERRTRRYPKKQSDLIPLATSLIDLPAELVAFLYQHRYTVEAILPPLSHL
jgi:hypothetical protein